MEDVGSFFAKATGVLTIFVAPLSLPPGAVMKRMEQKSEGKMMYGK